jgi:hypothetical protein
MWKDGEEDVNLKKIYCIRQDMRGMAVSEKMTSDRGEWREKIRRPQVNWQKKKIGVHTNHA